MKVTILPRWKVVAVKLLTFFLGKLAVTREVVHINTIRDKTFETNSSFYMKQRTMVQGSISIFKEFCDSKGKIFILGGRLSTRL